MANVRFLDQVSISSFETTGTGGGTSVDTGSLLYTASVALNDITFTKGNGDQFTITVDTGSGLLDTGSFLLTGSFASPELTFTKGDETTFAVDISAITASLISTGSVSGADLTLTKGDGTSFTLAIQSSATASYIAFDGDRRVSNTNLPEGIYNVNYGTEGLAQFVEAVFFPNSAPLITSVSYSIEEYEPTNTRVGYISASDAEGQTLTFATQSSYTDNYFTVNSLDGEITTNLIVTTALNTDSSQGYDAAPLPVQVTDTFGSTYSKTLYVKVDPNEAPKWRQDSVSGNVITNTTTSLNENSEAGSKNLFYYTDAEGDTVIIGTGSGVEPSGYFDLQISGTFVRLVQTAASLDYETYPTYSFMLTASDEHYPSPDPDSITYLPGHVKVVDNLGPTVNDQTVGSISENSSAGDTVGTITVTDPEGDVVTYVSFVLTSLSEGGVNVPLSTYGGTGQNDPTEDAFQVSSGGVVSRKSGVYLNSDLIDQYVYTVTVRDAFNTTTDTGLITITVTDDPAPSISDNWAAGPYIIESALDGDAIRTNSNGYSGTQADFNSNQSVTWNISSSNIFSIASNGQLSVNTDISGAYTSGDTITGEVTASNSFGTTNSVSFTVNITENLAPTLTLNAVSSNLTASVAVSESALVGFTGSDTQGLDNIIAASISGPDAPKFDLVAIDGASTTRKYEVRATASMGAGDFEITGSVTDAFGKTGTSSLSFSIVDFPTTPDVYIYSSTRGSTAPIPTNYNAILGNEITAGTPIEAWASGSLGDQSISLTGGTATLVGSASVGSGGSDLSTMTSTTIGNVDMNGTPSILYIVYPSGSDPRLDGTPLSMTDTFGGSTLGEYVLYYFVDAVDKGIVGSQLNHFELNTGYTSSNGEIKTDYTRWTVLGCNDTKFVANAVKYYVVSSSGSAPA